MAVTLALLPAQYDSPQDWVTSGHDTKVVIQTKLDRFVSACKECRVGALSSKRFCCKMCGSLRLTYAGGRLALGGATGLAQLRRARRVVAAHAGAPAARRPPTAPLVVLGGRKLLPSEQNLSCYFYTDHAHPFKIMPANNIECGANTQQRVSDKPKPYVEEAALRRAFSPET